MERSVLALLDALPEPHLALTLEGQLRAANRMAWDRLGVFDGPLNLMNVAEFLIAGDGDVGGFLRACARSNRPLVAAIQWPGRGEPQLCEGFRFDTGEDVLVLLRTAARHESSRKLVDLGLQVERHRFAIRKAEQRVRQYRAVAETDGLTGVGSRGAFDRRFEERFAEAQRHRTPIALLMIDIDHFKRFNDTAGHPKGDEVLTQVAACLQSSLMRPGDFLARYGGEEFSGILAETDLAGAEACGQRIVESVRALGIEHPDSPTDDIVTVSVGGSSLVPSKLDRWEALLETADTALYQAKRSGRNRHHCLPLVSRSRSTGS